VATVYKEIEIEAPAEQVWDALADFGALHTRLVPGFVTGTALEGDTRTVTFFSGAVAKERLVGCDADARRLAYTITQSPFGAEHHHASAQVLPADDGRSRFVWITDVLPDELAPPTAGLMDRGLAAMKQAFEG
jgi:Polyketide cyclase / dehydrase and lipid transport